jgi:Na+/proline symporter
MAGGMWSVALTDAFQAAAIVCGLCYVAWVVAGEAGGTARVAASMAEGGRMTFLPEPDAASILAWITAGLVIVLGSIPQQDVLQRIKSARTESTAVRATILGGLAYFAVASIPIFLVAAAALIDPPMVSRLMSGDSQRILPELILQRMPLAVQVLFFGALVSAILSTAGGALLAPAIALAENVVRPMVKPGDDAAVLRMMRFTVAGLCVAVTVMALTSRQSIYQLVNESGKVVLVCAFVPLAGGLFWERATARGAHASIAAGLVAWLAMEWLLPDAAVPPALAGFAASLAAMVAGSLLPSRAFLAR